MFNLSDELLKLNKPKSEDNLYKSPETIKGDGLAEYFATIYSSYLEPPYEFFYFAFLTCLGNILADKLTLASEIYPRPRLFTVLLGESADDRKSTSCLKTIHFFEDNCPGFNTLYGCGSAEGLAKKFNDLEEKRLVLFLDEMKSFVSKCRIESSVLLTMVNSLFENTIYQNTTKNSDIVLKDAHLSLLGASTVQTWENLFSSQFTAIGFINRLFIVTAKGERKFSMPQEVPADEKGFMKRKLEEIILMVGRGLKVGLTAQARGLFDLWYKSLEVSVYSKRLDTYALRLMPLLAVNEMKTVIDEEIVRKTMSICNWQLAIRRFYSPIDVENKMAQVEHLIRRNIHGKTMTPRDLKKICHYERYGLWMFDNALRNLERAGEIRWNKMSQTYST